MSVYFKNLTPPEGEIDVILDTDAYNEIDDQFAISYMVLNKEKFNVKGICSAPFFNHKSTGPNDGMLKSYDEIIKILKLAKREELCDKVFKGSKSYLSDEKTPVESDAAAFIANAANEYSSEKPLYIVAIGAITNVASAILMNEKIKENCVIVWLGGHATHIPNAAGEFNMTQDIAAARIIFGCGVPLVQLPCCGVVTEFATSKYELEHWLKGKNVLCDYLYENTVNEVEPYALETAWTRIIWDVTAVAWLNNKDSRFMLDRFIHSPIPEYDRAYGENQNRHLIKYVYRIKRDALFTDLFNILRGFDKY